MKGIVLILNLVVFLSCDNRLETDYFEVVQGQRLLFEKNNKNTYYKISLKGNRDLLLYPINVSKYSEREKFKMIEELLSFEGDVRICSNPISSYNSKISNIYSGKLKNYSIQLEALFLINQIFFEQPFDYSPIPILINDLTGKEETIKGRIIEKSFESYKYWFEYIREIGIEKAREEKVYPLSNSNISWLYNING